MSCLTFIIFIFVSYFFLVFTLGLNNNKYSKLTLRYLYIFIFSVVVAFRLSSVPDTLVYMEHYNSVAHLPLNDFGHYYFEPGYVILVKIYSWVLRGDVKGFFFFISVINYIIVLRSLSIFFSGERQCESLKNITLLYYSSFYGLYFNFVTLRLGLGASFFLLAVAYLQKSKFCSLFNYLFAIFFHKSFLMILPIYLFCLGSDIKIRKKVFFYLWIAVISFVYFTGIGRFLTTSVIDKVLEIARLFTAYDYYIDNIAFGNSKIGVRFSFNLLLAVFFVKYGNMKDQKYLKSLFIYFIGLSIYAFFSVVLLIDRISDICLIVGIFLIYNFYRGFKMVHAKMNIFFLICIINMFFALRIINR